MDTKFWKKVLVLSLLSLTACAGNSAAASLEGTSWQLVSLAGNPPVENTSPTISFEDGRVGGNATCNTYGGEYKAKDDTIEFGMMMSTEMACVDNDAMDQEQVFLAFLGSVERWEISDGQLLLFGADGVALVFEAQS